MPRLAPHEEVDHDAGAREQASTTNSTRISVAAVFPQVAANQP
jgi:hypothetical protein